MFDIPIWFYNLIVKAFIKISRISKDYIWFITIHLLLPPLHKDVMGEIKENNIWIRNVNNVCFVCIMILIGVPTSFAKSQYLANLTEVYGASSCDTCHNNGFHRWAGTSYGMLFENQSNHAANAQCGPDSYRRTRNQLRLHQLWRWLQ